MRSRQAGVDIAREAGDPFDAGGLHAAADISGHGYDSVSWMMVPQVRFNWLRIVPRIHNSYGRLHAVNKLFPVQTNRTNMFIAEI